MEKQKDNQWKAILDNILIYNIYILIIGAILLAISFILSINGSQSLYIFFQRLWYPVFIPSLSLFFTAILIEVIFVRLANDERD